jgi:hypothetical protein
MMLSDDVQIAFRAIERAHTRGCVPWLYEFQAIAAAEAVVAALKPPPREILIEMIKAASDPYLTPEQRDRQASRIADALGRASLHQP